MRHWVTFLDLAAVGAGGMIGAVCRYLLSASVQRASPAQDFPVGTMLVNLTGCFFIGLFAALARDRGVLSSQARLFLMVGILGGFTTFSSFAYESAELLAGGGYLRFSVNVLASVAGGLLAVWAGMAVSRVI
ncbi:MAG: fluoride efflux transporter CrcB [Elusimicrobiaceae bacterium]|nr:fluoride efflux transporter CrcB [Elusimicrobiaceae bacterium]